MVIDGGSCTNAVFEKAVKKLDLKVEPHFNPYKVAWVNNTSLKVKERCLVFYSIGGFIDKVQCDILPLKVCFIIFGRLWLFDKRA